LDFLNPERGNEGFNVRKFAAHFMETPYSPSLPLFPFVGACTLLFGLHQLGLLLWGQTWWFLDSFLDPLLAVPVLVGVPAATAGKLVRKTVPLPSYWIWAFALGLALLFECWIPTFDPRFTADPLDGIAYFLGAFGTNIALGNVLTLHPHPNSHESTR